MDKENMSFFEKTFWVFLIRGGSPVQWLINGLKQIYIPIGVSMIFCLMTDTNFFALWHLILTVIWESIVSVFSCLTDKDCIHEWQYTFRNIFSNRYVAKDW